MIKQFKEIDEFFKRHHFSEFELDLFKNDLKEKYQDNSILKQAKTLIELKLLAYQLSIKEDAGNVNKRTVKPTRKSTDKSKLTKKEKSNAGLDKKIESDLKIFAVKPIEYIATFLGYSPPKFLIILQQKGIDCKQNDSLSKNQFMDLKQFFKDCLRNIYHDGLKEKSKDFKKETKSKNKRESVYDTLKSYGPGKFIYIRSK